MRSVYIQAVVTRDGTVCQLPTFIVDMDHAWTKAHLLESASEEDAWQHAVNRAVEAALRILDPHKDAEYVSISAVSPEPHCLTAFYPPMETACSKSKHQPG